MDRSRFGSASTGHLVPISSGERGWAFVPAPLPRHWDIPNSLWPLLSNAKAELARLDGIGKALPDPELLLHPLNQREAIRSSSLEGTYATAEELLLFELNDRGVAPSERMNDWIEVRNYATALRHGTRLLDELPLSLRVIREMHRVLLTGVRGRDRAPGEFRRIQVHIGADQRFVPPPVNEIDGCLDDLERFLNDSDSIEPLVRTFLPSTRNGHSTCARSRCHLSHGKGGCRPADCDGHSSRVAQLVSESVRRWKDLQRGLSRGLIYTTLRCSRPSPRTIPAGPRR